MALVWYGNIDWLIWGKLSGLTSSVEKLGEVWFIKNITGFRQSLLQVTLPQLLTWGK